ncbi:hypothetical protein ABZ636_04740 [Streptomyces sp. NPDC007251]
MTCLVLPHEVHGDGARKVLAVRGYREAGDASGACTAAEAAGEKERQ